MTAANIRTTFAGQGDYNGLTTDIAHNLGVFPEEMDKDWNGSGSKAVKKVMNAMGGQMHVAQAQDNKYAFDMVVDGLSKYACSTLVTADWGSASGFLEFTAGIGQSIMDNAGVADLVSGVVGAVSSLCDCGSTENSCSLTWRFFPPIWRVVVLSKLNHMFFHKSPAERPCIKKGADFYLRFFVCRNC